MAKTAKTGNLHNRKHSTLLERVDYVATAHHMSRDNFNGFFLWNSKWKSTDDILRYIECLFLTCCQVHRPELPPDNFRLSRIVNIEKRVSELRNRNYKKVHLCYETNIQLIMYHKLQIIAVFFFAALLISETASHARM